MIEIENKLLKGFKFIDLFCGIGGFHLALSSFGAECVFASDIDKDAKLLYKKNFNFEPADDITKIKADDIPDHDIICAGFPCQPFSISGALKGFNDDKGRGRLFFDIIRIAKKHNPQIILLENVKNFEKHDKGKTLDRVKSELEEIGYYVFYKVLCATDFGIPQARKRIYIIAINKQLGLKEFKFPSGNFNFKTLNDILISENINQISGRYVIAKNYTLKREHDTKSNKLERIGQIGLGRQGERIYSPYGQSITLSSQGGGPGGKTGMYKINGVVRKLFPRECARLMGFPDNYILANTQEKNYKLFGNSVVVDVLQYIIIEIIKNFFNAKQ